jgi:hypothetical protein
LTITQKITKNFKMCELFKPVKRLHIYGVGAARK